MPINGNIWRSMTKCTVACKNMTNSHEQKEIEEEEEDNTSGSDVRTVRKPTEETPDAQSIRDVTEAVMEERRVEKLPLNTRDQTPRHLSTERCELTGVSDRSTESDLEESNDKESSSEVSWRTDRMEFIKEFQEIMNKAIEQLLNKPARKQTCPKNKPELNTEQEKRRKTICKEADMPPPRRVSRESDDEWNSTVLQEMMDTDKCIQRLVRSELEAYIGAQNGKL